MKVLLVEDSIADAGLIARELERGGLAAQIERVETEQDFRCALEQPPHDVILADYHLPRFHGMEALRIAQKLAPDLPFIFVSGSIGEERAIEALKIGATDYVLKDRLSRLVPAVERALEERRHRQLTVAAQNALRASEERLEYALLATQDVVWDWMITRNQIWTSEALRTHWGYTGLPSEVDLNWWYGQIHPDDFQRVAGSFAQAVQTGPAWSAEYRFRHANGSYRDVVDRAFIIRDQEGKPMRMIGAMVDVHDRLILERELERSKRVDSLGRVAATIAHEFNNVLMGIHAFAEVINKKADDTSIKKAAESIDQSVRRGKHIAQGILRFTRSSPPDFQRLELRSWFDPLMTELTSLNQKVTVVLETPQEPISVSADRTQLQQVILNLVLNAIDAMPQGGRVNIRLGKVQSGEQRSFGIVPGSSAFALLSVQDHGVGIPPEVVDQIFDPLFTTKRNGTGLGLAVVQQIISAHRGHIFVESTAGSGTAFHLLLPLEPAGNEREIPEQIASAPSLLKALGAIDSSEA